MYNYVFVFDTIFDTNMARPLNELPSIKVVFDRNKRATASNSNKPRTGLVQIVVSYRGHHKTVSTGVKIYADEWKNGAVVRRSDALDLQEQIATALHRVSKRVNELQHDEDFTLDRVSNNKVSDERYFCDWCRNCVDDMDVVYNTKRNYYSVIDAISEHGKMLRFCDVTKKNILDFYEWKKVHNGISKVSKESFYKKSLSDKVSDSTLSNYHHKLHRLITIAVSKGYITGNPIDGIVVKKGKSKERIFLSMNDIEELEIIVVPGKKTKSVIDMFLLQCGSGLSFIDLMNFRKERLEIRDNENGSMYVYRASRKKTNVDFYTILLPFAVRALERLNWEIPQFTVIGYNALLYKFCKRYYNKYRLTSHIGRHTFATLALSNGVRMEVVQKMLGHKNISTTEIYAKLVNKRIEDEMAGLATIKPSALHSEDGQP